jgi:two-component system, OmpR family, response regulator ChvI
LKKRLLVVDDEEDITDSLKLGLERHGFTVDVYNDPREAIAAFKPKKYDLVLLDIRMPVLSGFQVYRELSKLDRSVKVCFLTAFEVYEDEFKRLFPGLEVQRFIKKPISISDLSALLTEMTGPSV